MQNNMKKVKTSFLKCKKFFRKYDDKKFRLHHLLSQLKNQPDKQRIIKMFFTISRFSGDDLKVLPMQKNCLAFSDAAMPCSKDPCCPLP